MKENKTIYIIGGGVSGLIAAYELEQAGYFPKVIEQTAEVGGRVKTLQEKGICSRSWISSAFKFLSYG